MLKTLTRTAGAAIALTAAASMLTIGPAQAAGSVHLTEIYYNSPGTDTRSNTSLNGEWVHITNTTPAAVNLKGWVLVDASNHKYTFASYSLGKGKTVTVRTGHGTNTTATRYQNSGNYIWNNDKDKATLKRSTGAVQDTCSYNNAKKAYTAC
jgi:hypothetical protein